jgi:hypothetical protein
MNYYIATSQQIISGTNQWARALRRMVGEWITSTWCSNDVL